MTTQVPIAGIPAARAATTATFGEGFRATLPLWPGGLLFGIVYAVAARAAGLSALETLAMSVLVHAGAAQFAATGLIAGGAGPLAVTVATAVTNARHLLMGASVAGYVSRKPWPWRLLYAWHLSDESYGLATARFLAGDGTPAYALGANLGMIPAWVGGAAVGLVVGGAMPASWMAAANLVGPLIFLALLVPLLKSRRATIVAAFSALLALVGAAVLPAAGYLLLALLGGAALGAATEREPQRHKGAEESEGFTTETQRSQSE